MAALPNPPASTEWQFSLFGDADKVIGVVANYFQVLGVPGLLSLFFGQSEDAQFAYIASKLDEILHFLNYLLAIANATFDAANLAGMKNDFTDAFGKVEDLLNDGTAIVGTDPKAIEAFQTSANNLINTPILFSDVFYRPYFPNYLFSPATSPDVNYAPDIDIVRGNDNPWARASLRQLVTSVAWFGAQPNPNPVGLRQDVGTWVLDVQYSLPLWLSGISYWLTIHSLAEPDYASWLSSNADRFTDAAKGMLPVLESMYNTLVDGIVRTDIPSVSDFLGAFRCTLALDIVPGVTDKGYDDIDSDDVDQFVTFDRSLPTAWRQLGTPWNGIVGVVDKFGTYQQGERIPIDDNSHIVNVFDYRLLAPSSQYLQSAWFYYQEFWDFLRDSTYSWFVVRLRVATEVRWKQIYVRRGYGKIWSIIQNLRLISGHEELVERNDSNANWSVRALAQMVNSPPFVNFDSSNPSQTGYFLSNIIVSLLTLARGNGSSSLADMPPIYGLTVGGAGRPMSLRDSLQQIAI